MSYKMKGSPAKLGTIQGTSGHRAAQKEASPVKEFNWGTAAVGLAAGGPIGGVIGGFLGGKNRDYGEWQQTLEEEDLGTNMWSGTIFGRRKDKERRRRLKELRAQKKLGLDRKRIAESMQGTTMAGASSPPTEIEEI